jgi:hypothetical protein
VAVSGLAAGASRFALPGKGCASSALALDIALHGTHFFVWRSQPEEWVKAAPAAPLPAQEAAGAEGGALTVAILPVGGEGGGEGGAEAQALALWQACRQAAPRSALQARFLPLPPKASLQKLLARAHALGAWGAVQASGAGVAVALGGIIRDIAAAAGGPAFGYMTVYSLELVLLVLTLAIMGPLIRGKSSFEDLGNNTGS